MAVHVDSLGNEKKQLEEGDMERLAATQQQE